MRCFLAVPITGELADGLLGAGERIRNADPAWVNEKWVPRINLHVTLHFLGDVPAGEMEALCGAVGSLLDRGFDIDLTTTGLNAAPRASRASMIWGTFDDAGGRCGALARDVVAAVAEFDPEPDTKPFRAHATLVRARRPHSLECDLVALAGDAGLVGLAVSDPSVTLYRSELTPRGPVYSAVSTWHSAGRVG